jgi:hypothetical protein
MFATFHLIAKRASTIRRIYPGGHRLVGLTPLHVIEDRDV